MRRTARGGLTPRLEYEKVSLTFASKSVGELDMREGREIRRWERYNVMISVNVTMIENGKCVRLAGQACDISKGGLRLLVTRNIEEGTNLTMQFLLPYYSNELEILGVVRNRERFTHGVEFINPTAYQQHIIERTCDVFALLSD